MLFTSQAYLAAMNALLAEHTLSFVELVPENPFSAQLKNAVISALRSGTRSRFDEDHWSNMFNHEKRSIQLNIVSMAFNELGHLPMLPGEHWRSVKNPFVITDIEAKLDSAARDIQRRHGEVVRLRTSKLRLEDWGLADVVDEAKRAQPEASPPSLFFMAELPHPQHNTPLRIVESGGLTLMYYENPVTIGKITAGIAPPYNYPQVVVVSEKMQPLIILRSEQNTSGGLMLCALEPNGKHSNFGPCSRTRPDEFIKKAAEIAASYKRG